MGNLSVCIMQNVVSVNGLTATYCMFILYRKSRWLMVSNTMLRLNTIQNILMGIASFCHLIPAYSWKEMSCFSPKQKRLSFASGTASAAQTRSDAWWCLRWLAAQTHNMTYVVGDTLQKRQCPLNCKSEIQSLCIHKWACWTVHLWYSAPQGHRIRNLAQETACTIVWVHWRRAGVKGLLKGNQRHMQTSSTQLICSCMVTEPYTWPRSRVTSNTLPISCGNHLTAAYI